MKRTLLLALVAGIAFAQTASIYELSGDDAAEGLKLHDAMVKSNAAYTTWTANMSRKYGKGTTYGSNDLDFSPDFKHAVPKVSLFAPSSPLTCCNAGPLMTIPATVVPAISY